MLERAVALTAAGISVVPIKTDGSKAPAVAEWKPYQKQIANQDTLQR